jgi:hypothetical protein
MIAIGVMAAAVPEALTERAAAFAVGNAVVPAGLGLAVADQAPHHGRAVVAARAVLTWCRRRSG